MAKQGWGERLKERARELGLTDAAVARALDLPQKRYSTYVNEAREPTLETLSRICRVLRTTPDAVLAFGGHPRASADEAAAARLEAAVLGMSEGDRARTLAVVETLAAHPTAAGEAVGARGIRKPNTGAASRGRRKAREG